MLHSCALRCARELTPPGKTSNYKVWEVLDNTPVPYSLDKQFSDKLAYFLGGPVRTKSPFVICCYIDLSVSHSWLLQFFSFR